MSVWFSRPATPCTTPSVLSQTTPAATPEPVSSTAGERPTVTWRPVMPGGTGTGSAVVPSIRISWARPDGRPGRDSRNASSCLAVAPVEVATGRCMAAITRVVSLLAPDALPYWTTTPGPPLTTSVLPPTAPPASWLKRIVTVSLGWTMTLDTGPTPAGRLAGMVTGRCVCARACASEAAATAGPAEVQLSVPKASWRVPDGGSPSLTWATPIWVMLEMARRSPGLTGTGATCVGV